MSAAALIEAVASRGQDRLFVARALDPRLRKDLASALDYEELPFVRGRTIIPDDVGREDLVVAGHPNHLGIFDLPTAAPWIAVTGRWSSLVPPEGALTEVALEAMVEGEAAEASLVAVRDLAKRVTHRRGVAVAFPPESPVLVVLLAVDPAAVAAAMSLPGCAPLTAYDELPGGFRIEPPSAASHETLERYAAALERAIAATEVEESNRWT